MRHASTYPDHPAPILREPAITINALDLTDAQATTLRVALTQFHDRMVGNELGNDPLGRALATAYRRSATEILAMMAGVPLNEKPPNREGDDTNAV